MYVIKLNGIRWHLNCEKLNFIFGYFNYKYEITKAVNLCRILTSQISQEIPPPDLNGRFFNNMLFGPRTPNLPMHMDPHIKAIIYNNQNLPFLYNYGGQKLSFPMMMTNGFPNFGIQIPFQPKRNEVRRCL